MATGAALSAINSLYAAERAYDLFNENRDATVAIRNAAVDRFETLFETDQELKTFAPEFLKTLNTVEEYEICEETPLRAKAAVFSKLRPQINRLKGMTHRSQVGVRCRVSKDLYLEASRNTVHSMTEIRNYENSVYDAYLDLQGDAVMNAIGDRSYSATVAQSAANSANVNTRLMSIAENSVESNLSAFGYSIDQVFNPIPEYGSESVQVATGQGVYRDER